MISVVVPSYNHGRFLRQCIDSVIAQTYTDWELVIVDDRSPDDSVEIAKSYADPRISVHVNETNLGTYGNENRGLDLAKGELIAILNSDDFWLPTKLERQVDVWQRHPEAAFCYTRGHVTEEDGSIRALDHQLDWPREEVHDILPFEFVVNRVLASSLLFRKGDIRFEPTLHYSGDWVAMLELSRKGLAAFVDEPLCHWRIHEDQSSQRYTGVIPEQIRVRRAILEDLDRWNTEHSDPQAIKAGLVTCALSLDSCYVLVGDKKGRKEMLDLVQKLDPGNPTLKRRKLVGFLPEGVLMKRLWPGWDSSIYKEGYRKTEIPPLHLP